MEKDRFSMEVGLGSGPYREIFSEPKDDTFLEDNHGPQHG